MVRRELIRTAWVVITIFLSTNKTRRSRTTHRSQSHVPVGNPFFSPHSDLFALRRSLPRFLFRSTFRRLAVSSTWRPSWKTRCWTGTGAELPRCCPVSGRQDGSAANKPYGPRTPPQRPLFRYCLTPPFVYSRPAAWRREQSSDCRSFGFLRGGWVGVL